MSDINEIAKRENLTKEGEFAEAVQVFYKVTNYKMYKNVIVKIKIVNCKSKH